MGKLPKTKEKLERLNELSKKMKEALAKLSGAQGEAAKKRAKEAGTKVGIGAGVSFFGLCLAWLASLYIILVIILLVDLGLKRMWLSSLIVVGAFLILGGVVIAIGAAIAGPGAKALSRTTKESTAEIKQTGEEIKAEMEELQKVSKEEMQAEMAVLQEQAKVYVPVAAGACVAMWLVKRHVRNHRKKKMILKVIRMYEAERAAEFLE
ncbi:MAG: phage holin family protein [Actinobacteria bacterium]|nr:phage holin family protein [Actinomycetota bacterium]MBU2689082.1 phage holin family protein [Actinomycetota bacterium]